MPSHVVVYAAKAGWLAEGLCRRKEMPVITP